VNQCWTQKVDGISTGEREAARKAYEHARQVYRQLMRRVRIGKSGRTLAPRVKASPHELGEMGSFC